MDRLDPIEPTEKDAPLRYDIRLLGRILGETVRAQEGEEVLELVEHIRRTGVQFHRNADEAPPRPGTMAYALGRARQARFTREQLQGFFDHALCSPVLTAHPTEIRRKS